MGRVAQNKNIHPSRRVLCERGKQTGSHRSYSPLKNGEKYGVKT